jgi:hypothetical protein
LLPPISIPWLITGTAMLVFFFWTGIGRGIHAMLIGHVALAIPYVVLIVGAGMQSVRTDLEEAAMSLGSTPLHAFLSVSLPLLAPSIAAAALFSFAVSLDQFVVSYFLSTPGVRDQCSFDHYPRSLDFAHCSLRAILKPRRAAWSALTLCPSGSRMGPTLSFTMSA